MPDILHQFRINAIPGRVFEAFCSSRGLNNWWTLKSAGEPRLNQLYTFYFGPEYDWRAEVIHLIPGKEITWKMKQAMDDWMGTEVGIRLTEDKDGTIVDFFHKGWREPSDHFRISNFCWGYLLKGLKDYVEHGTVIPFEKRN